MEQVAFLFPGQETQYLGMGKDLPETHREALEVYHRASAVVGYDVRKVCLEGPEELLRRREVSQVAIVTTSLAILEVVISQGIRPGWVAGFSLGEFTALAAADVLSLEDVLRLVGLRWQYIQEAVQERSGAMAAIIGMEELSLLQVIAAVRAEGVVEIANYNSPDQRVITGEVDAVKKTVQLCKKNGARRAVLLPIPVPFHSSLIKEAAAKLGSQLENMELNKPRFRMLSNYRAQEIRDPGDLLEIMPNQLCHPVQWDPLIREMISRGVHTFVEIGPRDTLTRFVQSIGSTVDNQVKAYHVEDADGLLELKRVFP